MKKQTIFLFVYLYIVISILIISLICVIYSPKILAQDSLSSANETYQFVRQWRTNALNNGLESGQFIAVSSQGNVYVTDSDNNFIQKFDSNGKFITKWQPGVCGSEVLCCLILYPNTFS
jgi:hypothetical protein